MSGLGDWYRNNQKEIKKDVGGWFGKNSRTIICFAFVIALLVFFKEWISKDPGETIFGEIISNLPFCEFVYKTVGRITTYNPALFVRSSILLDLMKLLSATPLISVIRALLSRVLLIIPESVVSDNVDKQIAKQAPGGVSDSIRNSLLNDERSKYMSSGAYKAALKFVETIIELVVTFVTTYFINKNKDAINSFLSTRTGTIAGLVLIVGLFIAYSLIFWTIDSYIDKKRNKTISFSFVKTMVFNVLPRIAETFITTSLFLASYLLWVSVPYSFAFWCSVCLIVLWSAFKGIIFKKLQVSAVAHDSEFKFTLASFIIGPTLYYCYVLVGQMFHKDIESWYQFNIIRMLFNPFALPFFKIISEGNFVFQPEILTNDTYLLEPLRLMIFSITVVIIAHLCNSHKCELSLKGHMMWGMLCSCEIALVFCLYSVTVFLCAESVLRYCAAICLLIVLAFVIDALSKTKGMGFVIINYLTESFFLSILLMIMIYIAGTHLKFPIDMYSVTEEELVKSIYFGDLFFTLLPVAIMGFVWYFYDCLKKTGS